MRLLTTDRRTTPSLYRREIRTLKRAAAILEAYRKHAEGERELAAETGVGTIERLLYLEGECDE